MKAVARPRARKTLLATSTLPSASPAPEHETLRAPGVPGAGEGGGVGPPLTERSRPQRILTHAYSRVVLRVLEAAVAAKKRFSVYITESQPDLSGQVPPHWGLRPAVILRADCGLEAIARSQGVPRPAASRLPACQFPPGESHEAQWVAVRAPGVT